MDFEFNLDEVDIGASNSGLGEFSFEPVNQKGGTMDEPQNESRLPGEELLDEPIPEANNVLEEAPEKVEIELVGNENNGNNNEGNDSTEDSIVQGKTQAVSQADRAPFDFNSLISDTQKEAVDGVTPDLDIVKLEGDMEEGTVSPVVVEADDLESGASDGVETLDSYVARLKKNLNMDEPEESVSVDDLDLVLRNNKMNSSEYADYLRSLKKYYTSMNSKKRSEFEFSKGSDGSLIKKNIETGEESIIKAPEYLNVKDEIIKNKNKINVLLFSLDKMRRDMISDQKVFTKLSGQYDKEMNQLKELFSLNKELDEILEVIQNTQKISKTSDKIKDMKTAQVNNFSRVKEIIARKGDLEERVDAILTYINVNNSIIKNYEKTRNYYDVAEESYIVSRELPPKEKRKKSNSDEEEPEQKTPDISFWNPKSPKFESHTPEEPVSDLKTKAGEGLYSKFTKGQLLDPDDLMKKAEEERELGLKVEELDLGDDLEALEPEYEDGDDEGDGDGEGEEIDQYQFNDPSKMTKEQLHEMEQAKARDQAVPIPGEESSDSGGEDEEEGQLSRKELNRISRQLNKPVDEDENIKVIELNQDLTLKPTKCDDSKTKRSSIKTTDKNKDGKVRRRKGMDSELKNCVFPFKFKKKYHNECVDDGDGPICATERKENCALDKYAYCEKK